MTTADVSLLAASVASIQRTGRLVRTDWDLETFDVLPGGDPQDAPEPPATTVGIVLRATGSVVFYCVWEDDFPASRRDALGEFTVRANEQLQTSAFELNLATGGLSVRAGVEFGEAYEALSRDAFALLLGNALDEVERAASRYDQAVRAVAAGAEPVAALAAVD